MKRSELRRLTPLSAKTPLRRTALQASPLARSALHQNSASRRVPSKAPRRNTGPSDAVVIQVAQRDEWACVRCGGSCHGERSRDWSVQHRRARGMGGTRRAETNSPAALILLCGSATTGCHGWVETHPAAAHENGWAIRQSDDPLQLPVWHWQRGLIFLTADGAWSQRKPTTAEEAS